VNCGSPFRDRHTVDHKFFLKCCSGATGQRQYTWPQPWPRPPLSCHG